MIIRTILVTPFEQNARLLGDPTSGELSVIDPGGDVEAIVAARNFARVRGSSKQAEEFPEEVRIESIILTHAHIDHAGGVRRLISELTPLQAKKPLLIAHAAEKAMRQSVGQQALMFGLSPREYESVPEPDRLVDDGESIRCAGTEFSVLFTPGHSPGHISMYCANVEARLQEMSRDGRNVMVERRHSGPLLLAGDTLFSGSIGRTDLPGGNHAQLLRSIREKLLTLPDETLVLSGHGENTTIGRERRSNPFLI